MFAANRNLSYFAPMRNFQQFRSKIRCVSSVKIDQDHDSRILVRSNHNERTRAEFTAAVIYSIRKSSSDFSSQTVVRFLAIGGRLRAPHQVTTVALHDLII